MGPDASAPVSPSATPRILAAFDQHPDRSPLLVVDLDVVADRYRELTGSMSAATVFYAVKANPHPDVLRLLVAAGCSFDVASIGEVHACLDAGATPDALSYGNTIKKQRDIAEAYALGVRRFAFDSASELDKLVESAPGSTVACRILCDGSGAAWPLARKFGCDVELAGDLLRRASRAGLATGLSFHVGSQQFDPGAWDRALALVADLRADLRADGVELRMVNLGGGLPGSYREDVPATAAYGSAISDAVERRLGPDLPPEVIIEPGRFLVADAGVLRTEVVTVGTKTRHDDDRWVYLDVGIFSGLAEALEESIRYRIVGADGRPFPTDEPSGPVVLAGPTCDSVDVLYQSGDYELPLAVGPGDRLLLLSVGAYSMTYSTIGFNGFPPLVVEVLPVSRDRVPALAS
jgi:ornithine decarboxylase